jgi:uncharacterized protein (UPF0276 family)
MTKSQTQIIDDVGIGLRMPHLKEIAETKPNIPWFEVAPENYIDRCNWAYELFEEIASHYPIVAHGLMLSIGSVDEINWDHVNKVKAFLKKWNIAWFSDHLCFQSFGKEYFHDLMPLPFTKECVKKVSEKIRVLQDHLETPFAVENISYYLDPEAPEMTEWEFINEVIHRSGCHLMLDINNVYVNANNHSFDPKLYLDNVKDLPTIQLHMAGHDWHDDEIMVDTHGQDIPDPVWDLYKYYASLRQLPPTLIERDNNIPPLSDLLNERERAQKIFDENQMKFSAEREAV